MLRLKRFIIAASLAASAASGASAAPYTSVYAFGDSLSDVGNAFLATAGTPIAQPVPPYADGQFSNGPVWLQTFAAGLGIAPLRPSLAGGTDYAVGGARSGATPVGPATPADLPAQVGSFLAANPAPPPGALYARWAGSNDRLDALRAAGTPAASDPRATAAAAVANVQGAARAVAAAGARDILGVSVPDLGATPLLNADPSVSAAATALSAGFNAALFTSLRADPLLAGVSLFTLDAFALGNAAAAQPASFGFTDVTDACVGGSPAAPGAPCAATRAGQDAFLYWDSIHPTAAAHALIGQAALAAVAAPPIAAPSVAAPSVAVPEPASLLLVGAALAGLAGARRLRSARPA